MEQSFENFQSPAKAHQAQSATPQRFPLRMRLPTRHVLGHCELTASASSPMLYDMWAGLDIVRCGHGHLARNEVTSHLGNWFFLPYRITTKGTFETSWTSCWHNLLADARDVLDVILEALLCCNVMFDLHCPHPLSVSQAVSLQVILRKLSAYARSRGSWHFQGKSIRTLHCKQLSS